MTEVELRLEREDREGIVAVGSYLMDALKRIGFRFEADCDPANGVHFCTVEITHGDEGLSPLTRIEKEYLTYFPRLRNERLACQVKLERPGEVTVMTKEKKVEPKTEESSDDYRKEFADLPLEKQIADLIRLEAIAFGETVRFIINSPFKVFEKAMDVMAEFGFKLEEEAKAATRPEEHKNGGSGEKKTASGKKHDENKTAQGSTGK